MREAAWAQSELDAGATTKAIIASGYRLAPYGEQPIYGLFDRWKFDMVIFVNALELLVLGGAMLILAKARLDTGIAPAMVTLGLLAAFFTYALTARWPEALGIYRDVVEKQIALFLSANSLGKAPQDSAFAAKAIFVAATLIGPGLMILMLGIIRVWRPKRTGSVLASGLRTGGLALALALLVCYAVMIVATLQIDARIGAGLDRRLQNETVYLAELQGKKIPP